MKEETENFYLTTAPIRKLLLKFSFPCVLAMIVSALYNIVDQIFIGRSVGYLGNAATTIVFPFTVIALSIAMLIGDGCATLFSISLGSKDKETSKKCIGNAIVLTVIFSILLTVLGFLFKDSLLHLFGVTDASYEYALSYLKIILIGFPFYMFTSAMSSIIRADGSPGYSMLATLVGAIINIILDPIAIFVFGMGVEGAALATVIGQIFSTIMCIVYFRKPKLIQFEKTSFYLDYSIVKRICKLGISSFITQISIAIITCVANNVVVGANSPIYGSDIPLSAFGIVFKIFGIVIALSLGIAIGGQPIIGYNYGAKKYKRVLETYRLILIANIIVGIIATILFEFFPQNIVSLFGAESDLYNHFARLCFRIYLGGILLCCIQKSSCIFLQSIDKPFKAMILSLMRDVIFLVPGVCLLTRIGGLETMLWAGPIADVLAFIFTITFVTIEYKKLIKLSKLEEKDEVYTSIPSNFVITIDREFGSGGKYIGQELAKRFHIQCYDNELLSKVTQNYEIDLSTLEELDEKQKNSFWYSFATNYVFSKQSNALSPISAEDNIFLKQAKVIEELYHSESCIIIGRCSDYILSNKENVIHLFIYASDIDFKINRKMKLEQTSRKDTIDNIKRIDKYRANYYKHFTSKNWGDKNNYEISIDTSKLGVLESVDILECYIKKRLQVK